QRIDCRVGDVVAVHLEVPAQVGAGVGAAEAVGAQHGVGARDEAADLVGEVAHVVGSRHHRAGGAGLQALGDVGLARLGFGVHAVPALDVVAVAAQFGEAGAGPDVAGDAEVLVQQFGRGDCLAQDGAAAHQLHAQL